MPVSWAICLKYSTTSSPTDANGSLLVTPDYEAAFFFQD